MLSININTDDRSVVLLLLLLLLLLSQLTFCVKKPNPLTCFNSVFITTYLYFSNIIYGTNVFLLSW